MAWSYSLIFLCVLVGVVTNFMSCDTRKFRVTNSVDSRLRIVQADASLFVTLTTIDLLLQLHTNCPRQFQIALSAVPRGHQGLVDRLDATHEKASVRFTFRPRPSTSTLTTNYTPSRDRVPKGTAKVIILNANLRSINTILNDHNSAYHQEL